jgi:TolA-binding protein
VAAAPAKRTCPACGSLVGSDTAICTACGEDLTKPAELFAETAPPARIPIGSTPTASCPACGAANPSSNRFCGSCGATIAPQATRNSELRTNAGPNQKKKTAGQKSRASRGASTTVHISLQPWQIILISGIVVAGFILVLFLTKRSPDTPVNETSVGTQQGGPKVNLDQLDGLKAAVQANPGDAKSRLRYANALHDAMAYEDAIREYTSYLELSEKDVNARIDLGACYFELRKYDDAIREMAQGVEIDPSHLLGNFNLGIVHKAAGNTGKAAECFRKVISLAPDSKTADQARAILKEMGQSN